MLKDQAEKQPIISKVKNPSFNNVSFRNSLDAKSMKVFNEINKWGKTVDYSILNFIGSCKQYTFNFKNFKSLGSLAENIYNSNVSLDAAKQEQRRMEEKLEGFIEYNPFKDNYKNLIFFQMHNIFTKEEGRFSLRLKKIYFHCLNHMCLVKEKGRKKFK